VIAFDTNMLVYAHRPDLPAHARAFDQMDHWLLSPRAIILHESPTHLQTLRSLVMNCRVTGGALHDARIVALCLDHGVSELLTADRDFSRFPTLRVRNPLLDSR